MRLSCWAIRVHFVVMKTIIALVDFSALTPKIVKHTQKLALAFQSHVILLHGLMSPPTIADAGSIPPVSSAERTKETIEADFAKLGILAKPLTENGIKVSMLELPELSAEQIAETAKRHEADLIIVGSQHHSAFYSLIVGSVTSDVLKSATCPVLVVPGD